MKHDHQTLELLARQICESRNGPNHFDKPRTHKNHWRRRAARLLAAPAELPPMIAYLAWVCGSAP